MLAYSNVEVIYWVNIFTRHVRFYGCCVEHGNLGEGRHSNSNILQEIKLSGILTVQLRRNASRKVNGTLDTGSLGSRAVTRGCRPSVLSL